MNRQRIVTWFLLAAIWATASGCFLRKSEPRFGKEEDYFFDVATKIEYPDVESHQPLEKLAPVGPTTLSHDAPPEYWELSLEEVVHLALANSEVLRDFGAAVLRSPETTVTAQNPSLVETDPRFGVEAALSAFDARFNASAVGEKNDRAVNNILLGGGTRLLKQDLFIFQAEVLKPTAVGSLFTLRKNIDYDFNNAPGNQFPSAWNTNIEFEARQALLQGAGVMFNRIAGPGGIPGVYNGVLIARLNTDVELAELEAAMRDLVSNVENAYWDLHFAYRDLEARKKARDAALETWRRVATQVEEGLLRVDQGHQAREQYFRFQQEVENALTGRLVDGTRTNNGSSGGTFRGTGGVHVSERRLRLIAGIPLSDGRLIRPSDDPQLMRVVFDWDEVLLEALARRAELRRQKWRVKRRELELLASRNFLLPRLDASGRYRWRGFGNDLIDANGHTGGRPRFDNAYTDLTTGDFQEWQLGLELSVPIGFRQGHAAVRNAEIQLARQRALLKEQERQVVHDLASAVAELDRAHHVAQTAYNRRVAAIEQLRALDALGNDAPLDDVLNAQRRLADADSGYHRALAEYALAIKNVHFEKGSLLDHCQVYLAEGPWPEKAYHDAAAREKSRGRPQSLSYILKQPIQVTQGPYFQEAPPASHQGMEIILPDEGRGEKVQDLPPPEEPVPPAKQALEGAPEANFLRLFGPAAATTPAANTSPPVQTTSGRSSILLPNSKDAHRRPAANPPQPNPRPLGGVGHYVGETLSTVGVQADGSRISRAVERFREQRSKLGQAGTPLRGSGDRRTFAAFVDSVRPDVQGESLAKPVDAATTTTGHDITRPNPWVQTQQASPELVQAETGAPAPSTTAKSPPVDASRTRSATLLPNDLPTAEASAAGQTYVKPTKLRR